MIENRRLILPYAAPFLAYVFIASVLGEALSRELNYFLRIVATVSLLVWAWKWYMPLLGPKSPYKSAMLGVAVGLVGAVAWILLLTPFSDPSANEPWAPTAFALRVIAAGLLVPLFEEILMRGFIFRLAYQWWEGRKAKVKDALWVALEKKTVNNVTPGCWSWTAVIISTVVFSSGHHMYEWPASVVFGLLMTMLWVYRQDLLSCVVAHGVTNIVLACYVLRTGKWYLW